MAPARVVLVVPRQEVGLHEYLQRSLASVKNVEVVLDRRAASVTPPDERRRHDPETSERKILLCSLVRCPAPAPPAPTEPPPPANGTHRTLLWPGLRLDQL